MNPQEKALSLCQSIGITTMFSECNEGMTLPIEISKKIALIAVNEVIQQWEYIDAYLADLGGKLNPNLKYWYDVKSEIEKL